jgi:hypothetical protein
MKYFLTFIITIVIYTSTYSQTSICGQQFHKKNCSAFDEAKDKSKKTQVWDYNAQSKSGLFVQGKPSKLKCVMYKGMDYRISICCEVKSEKIIYKISNARTNELLFDNSKEDPNVDKHFLFSPPSTTAVLIEVIVPKAAEAKENEPNQETCVGLLIEHKVADKKGFSQY